MTAHWDPPIDLEVLLAALEAEILSCSDEELRTALAESGRAHDAARQEIRTVLDTAMCDDDAGTPPHVAGGVAVGARLWRH